MILFTFNRLFAVADLFTNRTLREMWSDVPALKFHVTHADQLKFWIMLEESELTILKVDNFMLFIKRIQMFWGKNREKAASHQELNLDILLVQPVLCHWATTTGREFLSDAPFFGLSLWTQFKLALYACASGWSSTLEPRSKLRDGSIWSIQRWTAFLKLPGTCLRQ